MMRVTKMRKKLLTATVLMILVTGVLICGCSAKEKAPEFVGDYVTYIWGSGLYKLEISEDGSVLLTDPSGHAGTGSYEKKNDVYSMLVDYEIQKIAADIEYDPVLGELDLISGSRDMKFYRAPDNNVPYEGSYKAQTSDGEAVDMTVRSDGTLTDSYAQAGSFDGTWSENRGYIDVNFIINGNSYKSIGFLTGRGLALTDASGTEVAVRN